MARRIWPSLNFLGIWRGKKSDKVDTTLGSLDFTELVEEIYFQTPSRETLEKKFQGKVNPTGQTAAQLIDQLVADGHVVIEKGLLFLTRDGMWQFSSITRQ